MKVLYSELKKYLPDLKADAKEVAQVFTITGFMIDKFFEVEVDGQKDFLLDLEVRQNRADSFGVLGLARELSAYYNIPLKKDNASLDFSSQSYELPIEVKTDKETKRLLAIKISDLTVSDSPNWLKEYLAQYDINSINNLVDLTNYVMILTGHPSHAFDTDLMGSDKLVWEMNNGKYKKFKTLSGEELDVASDAIVISDGGKPLSLSMIGGSDVAINANTKNIILEIAVYEGGVVRKNGRQMRVVTEAGSRLEKYLDPESIPYAFNLLVNLILENCGGEISSKLFESYVVKTPEIIIDVDLDKVQQVAGIEISYEDSINYLTRLGFEIIETNLPKVKVKRPIDRLDIELEEDVFEEIIRLKGFNNIPKDSLSLPVVKDITPARIKLSKRITDSLAKNGFDEVRSWILVSDNINNLSNYQSWNEIKVTNSINEEVSNLRQTISASLIGQASEMKKNNISDITIFEIGKVFGKFEDYSEEEHLGLLNANGDINHLKKTLETILRLEGISKIYYKDSEFKPGSAHPKACWDIFTDDQKIGIIYSSNKNKVQESNIAEVNLTRLDQILSGLENAKPVQEITQKIVELDTNLVLDLSKNVEEEVQNLIKNESGNVWNFKVIDQFTKDNITKYTVRVAYMHLTDPEAKELHRKIFN